MESTDCLSTNPKNRLQELYQKRKLSLPKYKTVRRGGPDHKPLWISIVTLHGGTKHTGDVCPTKSDAELSAAMRALETKINQTESPLVNNYSIVNTNSDIKLVVKSNNLPINHSRTIVNTPPINVPIPKNVPHTTVNTAPINVSRATVNTAPINISHTNVNIPPQSDVSNKINTHPINLSNNTNDVPPLIDNSRNTYAAPAPSVNDSRNAISVPKFYSPNIHIAQLNDFGRGDSDQNNIITGGLDRNTVSKPISVPNKPFGKRSAGFSTGSSCATLSKISDLTVRGKDTLGRAAILVDVENMPKFIDDIKDMIFVPKYTSVTIYAFVGEHHCLVDKDFPEHVVKIISPSTRPDGTDCCIQVYTGMLLAREEYDTYLIATRDHFGSALVEMIMTSNLGWNNKCARVVTKPAHI
jgi:hypothetical protein